MIFFYRFLKHCSDILLELWRSEADEPHLISDI